MKKKNLYLMPGMAASPKIFELLDLPKNISVNFLTWIKPLKNESLNSYAFRMTKFIDSKNPILVGVSLGGVLVQEISKIIKCEKIIIISSIKSRSELPVSLKMAKYTNIHKLLPIKWIEDIENLFLFVFGNKIKIRVGLYNKYLSERNPEYLSWAINSLVNWNQKNILDSLIHIHGEEDNIFPISMIKKPVIKIKGSHAIILTQANWFNINLPKIILN
ncbi:MAG: alpha/beta hydrolase [Candidatus Marivariicella sp.]